MLIYGNAVKLCIWPQSVFIFGIGVKQYSLMFCFEIGIGISIN